MGNSPSKDDTISQLRNDVDEMQKSMHAQVDTTTKNVQTIDRIEQSVTEVKQDVQEHKETGIKLKSEMSEVKNKLDILSKEVEKAREERIKSGNELKMMKLKIDEDAQKLEEVKLKIKFQQDKMKHQREMKEMEKDKSSLTMQEIEKQREAITTTVNQIKELQKCGLSQENFSLVLKKVILDSQQPDYLEEEENDEDVIECTEELDREYDDLDSFAAVDSPRRDIPTQWTRRHVTAPVKFL